MKKLYAYIPLIVFLILALIFARQLILGKDPSVLPSVLLNEKIPNLNLEKLEGYKLFSVKKNKEKKKVHMDSQNVVLLSFNRLLS